MGPRTFARGNLSQPGYADVQMQLQWGRALSHAEIIDDKGQNDAIDEASMGPRTFARGNGAPAGELLALTRASMGPRTFARGNL